MGLLGDVFNNEQGRLGLGLLAAAAPRADGAGFGQRLQEAVGYTDNWKKQKSQEEERKQQQQYQQMLMQEHADKKARDHSLLTAAQDSMISPDKANAMSMGPMPDGSAMPTVQPGFDNEAYMQRLYQLGAPDKAVAWQQSIAKDDAPVKLSPGESLYSGKASGYKPLLSVPKEFNKPAEQQGYELAQSQGFKGTYLDYQMALKKAGASSTTFNMSDGQKGFDNEMKLGGAFKQEPIYKDHAAVQSAFAQINSSLAQGTPISDTAAATKIMKILDPTSVVRESELGMAMAAGGRMDRLQNYVKQAMDGTKLTPQQRTDFGNLASELTAASAQAYNSKRSEYHQQGKDYGLNSDRALGKPVTIPSIMKPATAQGLSVTAPNGKTYTFNSEREMANWKMATGVK
jgi:Spy/CpxP family protein refolding chaperone